MAQAGDARDVGIERKIEKRGISGRRKEEGRRGGCEESASPRMSLEAPARRPDCLRHVAKPHPSPWLSKTAAGARPPPGHESIDFSPKGNRAERVQIVNGV